MIIFFLVFIIVNTIMYKLGLTEVILMSGDLEDKRITGIEGVELEKGPITKRMEELIKGGNSIGEA